MIGWGISSSKRIITIIFVLLILPITVFLVQHQQEIRKFASEGDHPKNISISSDTKPEYVKGEVIVKLADDLENSIKPDAKAQEALIESKPISFSSFDISKAPVSLKKINSKYKIKTIGKVFPKSKSTRANLSPQQASQGFYRLNSDNLATDISIIYKISFEDKNLDPYAVVGSLKGQEGVAYAEPNYIYRIQAFTDPYYLDSYPNNVVSRDPNWNPSYDYQWNLKTIKAEAAWDKISAPSSSQVKVAVIDTGVDYTHPDFGSCSLDLVNSNQCLAIAPGYNFVGDPAVENNNPMDDFGHGTHVAGIIGALANDKGIAGMASGVKIMPLKSLDNNGSGTEEDLAQAIYYAADNGAKIINASWGGAGESIVLEQAVAYAYSKGVVFVAAAGNNNIDAAYFFPANVTCADSANPETDCTLSVASTNQHDYKSYFSNYGTSIDVAAPGEEIISLKSSTLNSEFNSYVIGNNYLHISGTSMATPHVAALAALILMKNPSLTPKQVRNVILNGADDLGDPSFDNKYGFGRINALKSIDSMDISDIPIAKLSSPISYMKEGNKFKIYGSASAPNFSAYIVRVMDKSSEEGNGTGIDLVNLGKKPVTNGLLATADLSSYNLQAITLRLTTFTTDNKKAYTDSVVVIDKSIRDGFPINYNSSASHFPPLIADINNDGKKEIIYQSGSDAKIYALDGDGNNLAGWPKDTGMQAQGLSYWTSNDWTPIAVDIDSAYPGKEIIVPVWDHSQYKTDLLAFHSDGTPVLGWTKQDWDSRPPLGQLGFFPAGTLSSGVINGQIYIAMTESFPPGSFVLWGTPYKFHLFDNKGSELQGWPVNLDTLTPDSYHYYDNPVIADLDLNNDPEILTLADGKAVWAYSSSGQLKNKISIATESQEYVNKWFVADMNSDGKKEIVASTLLTTGDYPNLSVRNKIYILKSDGLELSDKWPYTLTETANHYFSSSISVGNYSNDNKPELLIYLNNMLHLLDVNANNLTGSPHTDDTSSFYPSYSSNISAKDGSHIIGFADDSYLLDSLKLFRYENGNFSYMSGFPKYFSTDYGYGFTAGYPALEDLDGDNKAELTVPINSNSGFGFLLNLNNFLYSFNTDTQVKSYDWPQYLHDEKHSNTYDGLASPTPAPTITPTITIVPTQLLKLNPSADSYVRGDQPTKNFGTQTALETDTNPNEITYIKFNLTPLSGKKILKATLTLKVTDPSTQAQVLRRAVNVNWLENTLNYNNRPGFEAVISNFSANKLGSTVSLGVTNVVDLRKGGNVTVGITSTGNDKAGFYSREAASVNKPQLVIEYQ